MEDKQIGIIGVRVCKRFLEEKGESINQNNASAGTIIRLTIQEIEKEIENMRKDCFDETTLIELEDKLGIE